jgi:hypothetical protein
MPSTKLSEQFGFAVGTVVRAAFSLAGGIG